LKHKYNYVLFQDDNPELAVERDLYEKKKILSQISFVKDELVLDIGCGVGRWGEELLQHDVFYVGIDYSKNLLEIADENLSRWKGNYLLINSAIQDMRQALNENRIEKKFQKIFINGVFMYLNDADLCACMEEIANLIDLTSGTIYIKESVSNEGRLTLNKFFSEDLKQAYTAIYRTADEYKECLVEKVIKPLKFDFIVSEDLYTEDLKNRKETKDYYFILKRGNS